MSTSAITPNDFGPLAGEAQTASDSPLASNIAQNTLVANKANPGNWSQNLIGGVMSALAGFAPDRPAPVGAGIFSGIGQAAQGRRQVQIQDQQMRMAQQKQQAEIQNQDRDYQLRVGEAARQQAKSVADLAEEAQRTENLKTANQQDKVNLLRAQSEYDQTQLDKENTLRAIGAKPVQIAGKEAPAFDSINDLEKYATDNNLHNQHDSGYRQQPVKGADGKYHLYEVPDEGVKQYTLSDAKGNPINITTTPQGALAYQEQVSKAKLSDAEYQDKIADAALKRFESGQASPSDNSLVASHVSSTVKAIAEGREEAPKAGSRSPMAMSTLKQLNDAYPDYDATEAKNYSHAREAFTTGTQGQAVNAGMVAFNHLKELQELNTPESRVYGSPAYVAYQNKITTVADELGKFYGSNTVSGLDELEKSLKNPTFRDEAIRTQARSMTDKMNEYQKQWEDAVPKYLRKAGQVPTMPGTQPEALANRDALLGTHKPGAHAPGLQEGATGTGSDGKKYVVKEGTWVPQQ
jgi:hypothetical protein